MSWLDNLKRMINQDPQQRKEDIAEAADRFQTSYMPVGLQGSDAPFGENPELVNKIKSFFSGPAAPSEPEPANRPIPVEEQNDRIARHKAVIRSILDEQDRQQAPSLQLENETSSAQEMPQQDAAQQRAANPEEYKNKLNKLANRYRPLK